MTKIEILTIGFLLSFFSCEVFAITNCFDVRLNDKTIFCINSGIGSISAESRANLIESKIVNLAKDYSFDPELISVNESEGDFSVTGGELNLVSLRAKDAIDSNVKLEDYARSISEKIKSGIIEYREKRSPQTMMQGALYTLLATVLLILGWMAVLP